MVEEEIETTEGVEQEVQVELSQSKRLHMSPFQSKYVYKKNLSQRMMMMILLSYQMTKVIPCIHVYTCIIIAFNSHYRRCSNSKRDCCREFSRGKREQ